MFSKIIVAKATKADAKSATIVEDQQQANALQTVNEEEAMDEERDTDKMIEMSIGCVGKITAHCDFTPPSFDGGFSEVLQETEMTSKLQEDEQKESEMPSTETAPAAQIKIIEHKTTDNVGGQILQGTEQGQNEDEHGGEEEKVNEEQKGKQKMIEGEKEKEDSKKQDVDENMPVTVVKGGEQKEKRKQKVSQELKSPFKSRALDPTRPLSTQEKKVSRALFAMNRDK